MDIKHVFLVISLSLLTYILKAQNISQNSSDFAKLSNNQISTISNNENTLPEFPGGTVALSKYLAKNIRYPKNSNHSSSRGKVLVSFKITSTGAVANAAIVEGINKILNKEAKRVVENMPNWKPAVENGVPISKVILIPIVFFRN